MPSDEGSKFEESNEREKQAMVGRLVTLADLRELNAPVRAHCNNCSRSAHVPTDGMPENTIVIHIARKLRCSRCGSKMLEPGLAISI